MVRNQWMRNEVISVLRMLSDREYQNNVWAKREFPHKLEYDSFDQAVHILFDDTLLADDPENEIGSTLRNMSELRKIVLVIDALNKVLRKLGNDKSDAEWANVIEYAKDVLVEFEADFNNGDNPTWKQ